MFADRAEAGKQLAAALLHVKDERPVVLGLPRGGMVVAAEIATALEAPLEVIVVRKIGAPHQPELALGAVSGGSTPRAVLNREIVSQVGVDEAFLRAEAARQLELVREGERRYRENRDAVPIEDRTVILVDDGIATGASMRAVLDGLRESAAKRLVLAVPVAPPQTVDELRGRVDEIICLLAPTCFVAVGQYYRTFGQVPDDEVIRLLRASSRRVQPSNG